MIRWPPLNVSNFITQVRNCVMGATPMTSSLYSEKPEEMLNKVFHQGLYCLPRWKQSSGTEIHSSETCPKRPKIGFHDQLSLNAGQKYCKMLQYFRPILSYHLSFRSLICLFLSGRFRQVFRNFDWQPLKIQNGQFHTYCINMYGIIIQNEKVFTCE